MQSDISRRHLLFASVATAGLGVRIAQAAPATEAAMSEYYARLAIYQREFGAFDARAQVYWSAIGDKRRGRYAKRRNHEEVVAEDYVLTQPPLYTGPAKPSDPSQPNVPSARRYVPVVADFLRNAQEQFGFTPTPPASEIVYKRTYARIAAAAGLNRDQVVRIYSFESGGNGRYDVQAGLEYARPNARAISTALGYNQLLHTNTVELVAEQGDDFVKALQRRAAATTGQSHGLLESKIAILQRMVRFSRTVPDDWSEHEKLAITPRGLGIHSLTLDVDIGPYAQTQKLMNSVNFARMKGFKRNLTAAELEMMNLTGDGTGFDMVTMPEAMRDRVPTSNFFQRSGYERNPVAIRNNTVKALLAATDAKMDTESKLQGAKELAQAFD